MRVANFEALTKKFDTVLSDPSGNLFGRARYDEAVNYTILVISPPMRIILHEYFIGSNVIGQFLDTLKEIGDKLLRKMHFNKPPIEDCTYNPEICHICGVHFKCGDIKCVDNCHASGVMYGLAHQVCNLNNRSRYFILVLIHNAKNYDTHFILKNMPRQLYHVIRKNL